MKIRWDVYNDWFQAYIVEEHPDPHLEFSELQGISRIEAKKLCYKVAYTLHIAPVMRAYCQTNHPKGSKKK